MLNRAQSDQSNKTEYGSLFILLSSLTEQLQTYVACMETKHWATLLWDEKEGVLNPLYWSSSSLYKGLEGSCVGGQDKRTAGSCGQGSSGSHPVEQVEELLWMGAE